MQSICAYETAYIGVSAFCGLFTLNEWAGFEQTLDMEYFYDVSIVAMSSSFKGFLDIQIKTFTDTQRQYSFGNPTGRAQGIGYLQELIARLTNQYITSSNSSVNSTITNNPADFPLGEPFYADFTHDDIIISVMTAMSLDYFNAPPNFYQVPPDPNRPFILSHMTPFGGRVSTLYLLFPSSTLR